MKNNYTLTPQDHIFRKITFSTSGITLILIGIKFLGFFEKQVLAAYFGTGYEVDAYFAGFSLMIVFWDFLRGLMAPSYLPTLMEYRSKVGEEQSWEFTSTVFNMMGLVFLALIGLGLLLTPQLISLAVPGFAHEASFTEEEYIHFSGRFPHAEHILNAELGRDGGNIYLNIQEIPDSLRNQLSEEAFEALQQNARRRFTMTVGLTRLMLTGAAFFAIAILTGLTLNSYKRFILAVTDDVVFKVSGFLGLVLLARYIGIYGLAWGIALGSWIAPLVHLIGLRKHLPLYRAKISFTLEPVRKMFRLMAPLIVGVTCIESRRLIDNWFASKLRIGSVAALTFGYKLIEFPYVAIAEPLSVVVLPYFSDLALQRDHAQLSDTLMTTLRTVVLVFTPLSVCLFVLRHPVVRLLFERGEFDAASTRLTVAALTFYAVGLVSFALDVVLLKFYFSLSDTLTPAILEVVTITLHTLIISASMDSFGHAGIALAFTVSKTLKVGVLLGLLRNKLDDLQLPRNVNFLGKMVIAVGLMFLLMSGYQAMYGSFIEPSSFLTQAILIVTAGGLGGLSYCIAVLALNVEEVRLIAGFFIQYVKGDEHHEREDQRHR